MDVQTWSDRPSVQTQPALLFQHTHTRAPPHTHICAQTCINTHTQPPSVTSNMSASGPEKRWLDRWCNNIILWIRVINVWYRCLYCVKHTHTHWSFSSWMSGITYIWSIWDNNLEKKSEKNEMGEKCFAFEVQRVHFFCHNWDLSFRLVPFFSSSIFL